jgi:hypothetical protein
MDIADARWARLVPYLARARAKPTFDAEERDHRLEVAEELRAAIRIAGEGGAWTERMIAVLTGSFGFRRYDLTDRTHNRWIRNLSSSDTLGAAVARFADAGSDPVERFASFVRAAEEQQPKLRSPAEELAYPDTDRDAVLSFGALLNFACAPEELPAVRLDAWDLLEQTLGLDWTFRMPLVDRYRVHLDFARAFERRLVDAGIEVRDTLDTQSLIHIAGTEADFWAGGGKGARTKTRPGDPPPAYLSICAIYRDEADYLAEWVEFHRLVGVERFFLYNNFSEDHHRDVLAPYVEEGVVTIQDWPVLDGRVGQIPAYNDCLRWHRHDSRWIAFLDLDEFLFSPGGESLPSVLADYEQWPAVAVRWAMFGTSGHKTRPPGLVIENYQRRIDFDGGINMKTVADPTRVTTCLSAHHFGYPYLSAVDENHFPVHGTRAPTDSSARLRLNHYHWKSEEEYIAKCARMRSVGRPREVPDAAHFEWLKGVEELGRDDDAIRRWAPDLRRALKLSEPETARRIS